MSREIKIPIYMRMANIDPTKENISAMLNLFSDLSMVVLESAWVPGAVETLKQLSSIISLSLITATSISDITKILTSLNIIQYFQLISGSEVSKTKALEMHIDQLKAPRLSSVFIGDSLHDWKAAQETGVPFVLRKTSYNTELQDLTSKIKYNFFDYNHG